MVITYFGGSSFRIQSGETSVLIDPSSSRLKGDVVLNTEAGAPLSGAKSVGDQTEIGFAGEYESKGIEIRGFSLGAESGSGRLRTAYLVRWEGIAIAILTALGNAPDAALLEGLNEPDILIIRLGAGYFSEDAAEKTARQIEPKVVIPAYEKSPHAFLKAMGGEGSVEEKFVFRKKDLEVIEGTKTIALQAV